jgi:hypothetical protein
MGDKRRGATRGERNESRWKSDEKLGGWWRERERERESSGDDPTDMKKHKRETNMMAGKRMNDDADVRGKTLKRLPSFLPLTPKPWSPLRPG